MLSRTGREGRQFHQPAGTDLHKAERIIRLCHGIEIHYDTALLVVRDAYLGHECHAPLLQAGINHCCKRLTPNAGHQARLEAEAERKL